MDLLSQRYASPYFFMDGMIQTGRLCEFVDDFLIANQKAEEEKVSWEFYLHKVYEGTYEEFKQTLETTKELQNMSVDDIETTVIHSIDILNNFNPEERGENLDGTV